ncbi:MAG: hypothetical protein U9Q96_01175 [Patescibacteria group bacterium]|nr:hypothetical protein [Patescibacteria group bacterium]
MKAIYATENLTSQIRYYENEVYKTRAAELARSAIVTLRGQKNDYSLYLDWSADL